jgi:hypothetical protein
MEPSLERNLDGLVAWPQNHEPQPEHDSIARKQHTRPEGSAVHENESLVCASSDVSCNQAVTNGPDRVLAGLLSDNQQTHSNQQVPGTSKDLTHLHINGMGLQGTLMESVTRLAPHASVAYLYSNHLTNVSVLSRLSKLTMLYLQVRGCHWNLFTLCHLQHQSIDNADGCVISRLTLCKRDHHPSTSVREHDLLLYF